MFSWLMSKYYDFMLRDAETKCLHDWRKALLQDLSGDVLELGSGTGANLCFYPNTIKRLILAEPCPYMRQQLAVKLKAYPMLSATVMDSPAESIAAPDGSFDVVVSTLVLCSVKDPRQALSEIYRVLKPRGKLVFIEHVMASDRPERLKWQRRLEPIWKILQCGCHLTRDTEADMLASGFSMQDIKRQSMRGVPPVVRPSIKGIAVKI